MKDKSLLGTVFALLFAIVGFIAHIIAVFTGSIGTVGIVAFVYVTPLVIDAIEDVNNMTAENEIQYKIDKASSIVGSVNLLVIFVLWILQSAISGFQINGGWSSLVNWVIALLPSVHVLRVGYVVRVKAAQCENLAKAYFNVK